MVRELMQNAHRAGATRVEFVASSDGAQLTVTNNGRGCPDPQVLLTAGDSQWNDVIDPAGLGFFSLLAPDTVASVTVESCGWKITLRPERVLAGMDIQVDSGQVTTGLRTTIRFKGVMPNLEKHVRNARGYYPLAVFLNGQEIVSDWKPDIEINTPVGIVGLQQGHCLHTACWEYQPVPHPNEWMQAVHKAASQLGKFPQVVVNNWAISWLIDSDCGVRPKLPDRESLTPSQYLDNAAGVVVRAATNAVREKYAGTLKNLPDEYCGYTSSLWNTCPELRDVPARAQASILEELGWRCVQFDAPDTFSAWSRGEDQGTDCDQIIVWSRTAQPVLGYAEMVTVNNLKARDGGFPFMAHVSEHGQHARITGLKVKKGSYVALASKITIHGMSLPYLLLDDDSALAEDVHVVIAGTAQDAIRLVRQDLAIAGWVASRVNEIASLYDEDGWMTPDDEGDSLDLSAVAATLVREISQRYGDAKQNRRVQQYYELCEQREALHEGWRIKHLKPPVRKVAPEIRQLVKAYKNAQRALDKAIERYAVEAGLEKDE